MHGHTYIKFAVTYIVIDVLDDQNSLMYTIAV